MKIGYTVMKIGDYVRTIEGNICKIKEIQDVKTIKVGDCSWIERCCIERHSDKLIDLIEVGDMVNGSVITTKSFLSILKGEINLPGIDIVIKSILTKEQYERYALEVENDN